MIQQKRITGYILRGSDGKDIELDRHKMRLGRMSRRVHAWSTALKSAAHDLKGSRHLLITLTYRPGVDWAPGQIRAFMLGLRKYLKKRLLAYAWVAELTKKGRVHYHIQLEFKGNLPDLVLKSLWQYGFYKVTACKHEFYLVAHSKRAGGKKAYQKRDEYPLGIRMFAVWVSPALLSALDRLIFRSSSLPLWMVEIVLDDLDLWLGGWARAPGGGWVCRSTGEIKSSGFSFVRFVWA